MADAFKNTIGRVQNTSTSRLPAMVDKALGHALLVLHKQHSHSGDEQKLVNARADVVKRFTGLVRSGFDRLLGHGTDATSRTLDFDNLSLVDSDVQEAHIALEGMAAHARNCEIKEYLRFTVRINAQFYNARVDESNNPLDPGQLAEAFKQAVRPVGLSADALLDVYREFNRHVLHQLGNVLKETNELLVESGIAPNLENLGRTKQAVANRRGIRREKTDANTVAFRARDEAVEEQVETKESPALLDIMVELLHKNRRADASNPATVDGDRDIGNIASSDITALVALLFKAIDNDPALPEAPRILVGKAQESIHKLALADPAFFNRDDHPARRLIDELAAAGISWTQADQLLDDQLYRKAHESISAMIDNCAADQSLVESLLADFLAFKKQLSEQQLESDIALSNANGSEQRKEDINRYAQRRISERIADQSIPTLIRSMLDNQYQKFLVEVILRDGPGSDSWKPVMDTLDVLLWSVAPGKTAEDQERLAKVGPRLMSNLGSVLKIAGMDAQECKSTLTQIQHLQQESFSAQPDSTDTDEIDLGNLLDPDESGHTVGDEPSSIAEHSSSEVRKLAIGMWFEFDVDESHKIRCTLASKIPSIDRYIFVNRQGIKVVEQSGAELAHDLQSKTARLINDGKLIHRAIDTVIANLRSGS